jgi:hypothetical protein
VCDVEESWPQPERVTIRNNVVENNGASNGLPTGVGVGCEFADGWEATLAFRRASYEEFGYKSHLPDGIHWESIRDKPYADTVSVGLSRRW